MNIDNVALAWSKNEQGYSDSTRSTGDDLYSYNLRIGYTHNGLKIAINYTKSGGHYVSTTTGSKHVAAAKSHCNLIVRADEYTQNGETCYLAETVIVNGNKND